MKLRTSRNQAPDAGHVVTGPSATALDVELPSDVSKRICIYECNKDSSVVGTGCDSIDALSAALEKEVERDKWLASARVAAILGSCSLSQV